MNHRERLQLIKSTPLPWREVDNMTAAEKYMADMIDLPLVDFLLPCFPIDNANTANKIYEISELTLATLHLSMTCNKESNARTKILLTKVIRVYEQESIRQLSHLFSLTHDFWTSYYKRQTTDINKALVSVDAMHHATNCMHNNSHQLVTQCLQQILTAIYQLDQTNKMDINNRLDDASRLLVDLPVDLFREWLQAQKQ